MLEPVLLWPLLKLYAELIKELLGKDELDITDKRILQKLKPGDHVCSGRKNDTYYHHGIYVGKNRVIHLQGPHKVNDQSVVCKECGYTPKLEGTVVKTCLDCFCVGNLLCICEYGIRGSEAEMESWVSEKVNANRIIYTYRNGYVHLGIWTDDKTVVHLARPHYNWVGSAPCPKCRFRSKRSCFPRKTDGWMVETCLECFLRGGFLYANEHRLHVTSADTDTWISHINEIDHHHFIQFPPYKMADETIHIAQTILKMVPFCNPFFHLDKYISSRLMRGSNVILVYNSRRVRIYQHDSIKPADEVVANAHKYLTEEFGNYNILTNNCEHFAFMCKTDVCTSLQVNTFPKELTTSLIRNHGRVLRGYARKLKEKCGWKAETYFRDTNRVVQSPNVSPLA